MFFILPSSNNSLFFFYLRLGHVITKHYSYPKGILWLQGPLLFQSLLKFVQEEKKINLLSRLQDLRFAITLEVVVSTADDPSKLPHLPSFWNSPRQYFNGFNRIKYLRHYLQPWSTAGLAINSKDPASNVFTRNETN